MKYSRSILGIFNYVSTWLGLLRIALGIGAAACIYAFLQSDEVPFLKYCGVAIMGLAFLDCFYEGFRKIAEGYKHFKYRDEEHILYREPRPTTFHKEYPPIDETPIINQAKSENIINDNEVDRFADIRPAIEFIKHNPKSVLTALSYCTSSREFRSETSCPYCPFEYFCDPDELPVIFRDLLLSILPNNPRSIQFANNLDLCIKNNKDICSANCSYYARCQNKEPWIFWRDIEKFLTEVGAYEKYKD